MEKINILIEKYGLTEKVAYQIENGLAAVELFEKKLHQTVIDKNNADAIKKIIQAEPETLVIPVGDQSDKLRIKHDASGNPYKSIKVGGSSIAKYDHKINKVSFKIGSKTVSFNDPVIIEKLRRCLSDMNPEPIPPKEANRPADASKRPLKTIIELLLIQLPDEPKQQKKYKIGEIFALFLDTWTNKTPTKQLQDIDNILRIKQM